MAGKLGIVSVYVDCLDHAHEGDQKDTQPRHSSEAGIFARPVFC
jgi:hypothetical protein